MAKTIINYDLFTNKKEELKKIQRKRSRNYRIKMMLLAALLVFVAGMVYFINKSTSQYYEYEHEEETADSGDVRYEEFEDGYLKYSGNGIEYQEEFGESLWNYPLSVSSPFVIATDSYAILGEKGGNRLMLFNRKGLVKEYTMIYPISQAGVCARGLIEVIMKSDEGSYIQVYDLEGKLVADLRSSIQETGYPLTAAISPDGTQLAVSYYTISGMHGVTNIVFYNLGRQLRNQDDDRLTQEGTFVYEDIIVPKMSFLSRNTMLAIGDGTSIYFKVNEVAREGKKIKFAQTIVSVFEGNNCTGYILDNETSPEEGRYLLKIYNSSGKQILSKPVDMNYDRIRVWNKQILAIHDNECTIMTFKGNVLFRGELEGDDIDEIIPIHGYRRYKVIFPSKTVDMKLKFWK